MNIELALIIKSAHKENKIPSFFRAHWIKTHGLDPIKEEVEHDIFQKKVCMIWELAFFFIILFVLSCAGLVFSDKNEIVIAKTAAVISGLALAVTFVIALKNWKNEKVWQFQKYFESIGELFTLFGIEPSLALGRMSREEFTKNVAETLKSEAACTSQKSGFERAAAMEHWKEMHSEALKWDLCKEQYDTYFH